MFDSPEMRQTLKRLLRSQMAAKGVDYRILSQRLSEHGIVLSESNLRSRVNSGGMGAQLFLYCQFALHISQLDMSFVKEIFDESSLNVTDEAVEDFD